MLTLLVLNKLLAVFVGPAGYAIIGQFQNFIQIATAFATGAISTGVTKLTADHATNPDQLHRVWRTAAMLVIGLSAIFAFGIVAFRQQLANYFLHDPALSKVFIWLAVGLVPLSLNVVLLAIMNGKKELERFVASNIAGSLIIFLMMSLLSWKFRLEGALIALCINQSVVVFVTVFLCRNAIWFKLNNFFGRIDWQIARTLFGFTVMAGASAIAGAISSIAVRTLLTRTYGLEAAGLWDAMYKISAINWTVFNTTMSFYFLPRIAELVKGADIRREIVEGVRLIMPFFIGGAVVLFLARGIVIELLFTKEFAPMHTLFAWQLAGDVFRVASWFFAYVMIAKSMVKSYVVSEIAGAALFVSFSYVGVAFFGLRGVTVAHFATYLIILPLMYALSYRRLNDDAPLDNPMIISDNQNL
jgi:polysaccharide transporter, PST family